MDKDARSQKAQQRAIDIFTAKPANALKTKAGAATIAGGLTCTFREGEHKAVMDMPEPMGGEGVGPTPGFYGRAALAGCIAVGVKMTAVRDGLRITSLTVHVDQDYDYRGVFALADAPASAMDTRLRIRIESPEPPEALEAMVDRALANDPWFLSFRDSQPVSTELVHVAAA